MVLELVGSITCHNLREESDTFQFSNLNLVLHQIVHNPKKKLGPALLKEYK